MPTDDARSPLFLTRGTPAPLPCHLAEKLRPRPLTKAQIVASLSAIALGLSPLFLLLAHALVAIGAPGWITDGPALTPWAVVAVLAAILLFLLARRPAFARWCGRLALVGCAVVLAGAIAYAVAGFQAIASVTAGPALRAKVVQIETRRHGPDEVTFRLQDSSSATVSGYRIPSSRARCYSVRRISGRHGFAWLSVVGASPAPGPGQLDWPVSRKDCFSTTPLAELQG